MQPGDLRFEDLSKHLTSVVAGMQSFDGTNALAEAKVELQRGMRAGFNSSIDVETGESWAPRKGKYPHPPLMRSGAMMQAATGGGAGSIARIEQQQLEVGVSGDSIKYANYQQGGTKNKDGSLRMVARPFVGASAETLDLIGEKIADAGLAVFG
jgi:phage gpG-like protein